MNLSSWTARSRRDCSGRCLSSPAATPGFPASPAKPSPGVELLDHLLETFFQLQPQLRTGQPRGCLFLDEIQRIPGWEGFVRCVMDTEPIDVVVSGSSAEMLSSEIASSLRGRAVEAVVFPFSFRECLRHAGLEPPQPSSHWSSAERSQLAHQLELYLHSGGFPELQQADERSRRLLLSSYVDSTVLLELLRQGAEVGYLRTSDGFEVDFHACFPDGRRELIQVCADLSDGATRQRGLRALQQALQEPIGAVAQARVISLDRMQPSDEWPEAVSWSSALEWLLQA